MSVNDFKTSSAEINTGTEKFLNTYITSRIFKCTTFFSLNL